MPLRLDKSAKGLRQTVRTVAVSLTGNYTLITADLCRRWVFTVDAARDVDVAIMTDRSQWVEVANDSASTNDVTVKQGATTVATLTPGDSARFGSDASGVATE